MSFSRLYKIIAVTTTTIVATVVVIAPYAVAQDTFSPLYDDQEFLEALRWMNEQGYTKYSTPEHFRPFDVVSRQEGAHFLATFANKEIGTVIDTAKYCAFDDLEQADPTLKNSILLSCLLHLFKGSNGQFRPLASMTKAEVLATIVRAVDGFRDESGSLWWEDYYLQAYERGLTREVDRTRIDVPVSRYEMSLLLNRAAEFVELGKEAFKASRDEEEKSESEEETRVILGEENGAALLGTGTPTTGNNG